MNLDTARLPGSPTAVGSIASQLLTAAPHDYDCVVGNVAALLGLHHRVPDRVLGSVFCASPAPDATGRLSFGHIGARQLERAVHTGILRLYELDSAAAAAESSLPHLAVGDGFDMPWTPYHRRKHIEHGFLVIDTELAFDAYRTITEFGEAVPTVLTERDLHAVPVQRRVELRIDDTAADTAADPVTYRDDGATAEYRRLLDDQRLSLDHLALDTWLSARARRVNARYRAAYDGHLDEELSSAVQAWTRASELVYVALRRAGRNRPVPLGYIDAMHAALDADAVVTGRWE